MDDICKQCRWCTERRNDDWSLLFAKQKEYRERHNVSPHQFLRMAGVHGFIHYLIDSSRYPAKNRGAVGYDLREFIRKLDMNQVPNLVTYNDTVQDFAYYHEQELNKLYIRSLWYSEDERVLVAHVNSDGKEWNKDDVIAYLNEHFLNVKIKIEEFEYL